MWDIHAERSLGPPVAAHNGAIVEIALDPNGKYIASRSTSPNIFGGDPRILVWELGNSAWIEKACEMANRGFSAQEAALYSLELYGEPCLNHAD